MPPDPDGNTDAPVLFDVTPVPASEPEPVEKLSADRRRTLKQRQKIDAGWHPLMPNSRTRPEFGTCGDCAHRLVLYTNGNRKWPKCDLREITHGAGSDCRAWWPACDRFEPGDNRLSPDAARYVPEHAERGGVA